MNLIRRNGLVIFFLAIACFAVVHAIVEKKQDEEWKEFSSLHQCSLETVLATSIDSVTYIDPQTGQIIFTTILAPSRKCYHCKNDITYCR